MMCWTVGVGPLLSRTRCRSVGTIQQTSSQPLRLLTAQAWASVSAQPTSSLINFFTVPLAAQLLALFLSSNGLLRPAAVLSMWYWSVMLQAAQNNALHCVSNEYKLCVLLFRFTGNQNQNIHLCCECNNSPQFYIQNLRLIYSCA